MTAEEPPIADEQPSTLRDPLEVMVQQVVDDVLEGVPQEAAPSTQRREFLVRTTRAAVEDFLSDNAEPDLTARVDKLFRRLGQSEAQRGRAWASVEASLRVASRAAWQQVVHFATGHDLSRSQLQDLTGSVFDYLDHVHEQLSDGFERGQPAGARTREGARARLFKLFLSDRPPAPGPSAPTGIDDDVLRELAEIAQWPLAEEVVVLAISYHGEPPVLTESPEVLVRVRPRRVLMICPAPDQERLIESIGRSRPDLRTTVSWPVPPSEAGSALRWCQRALDLVHLGVIAPEPVIDCAAQAAQLWLHAEPSMRRHLCQELLRPLLAEAPHSRTILSETLLAWVETRDSAPVIAARLAVHPQTVRYRWKRINELFGEALRDPEFVIRMTLVLKSSVPLWKAGDQSDFDLFKDRESRPRKSGSDLPAPGADAADDLGSRET